MRTLRRTYLVVLAILVLTRLGLPAAVRAYAESVLNGMEGLEARIGDIDLNLWRGAYEIERLVVSDEVGDGDPLLECARLDLAVHWGELLDGTLVASVVVHRPVVRFRVDDTTEKARAQQTGVQVSWSDRLRSLSPLRIDRFAVRDAELHYERRLADDGEVVDLFVEDLYAELLNLTNRSEPHRDLESELELAGRPFGTGQLEARGTFSPVADPPRLELGAQILGVELTNLNDYILAYLAVDVESGELATYAQVSFVGDEIDGYVKVLMEGVEAFDAEEIGAGQGALEVVREASIDAAAELLENQPNDRLGAQVPLSGRLGDVRADVLETLGSVLHNAFVEALRPSLERAIVESDDRDDA